MTKRPITRVRDRNAQRNAGGGRGSAAFVLFLLGLVALVRMLTVADIPPLPPVLPERQASEEILEDSHPESVPPQKANTSQFVRADGTAGEVRPLWTRPVGEENPLAPTSTSRPSRLAVEQRVRDAFDTYFTGLAERYGDLIILSYPRNAPGDDEIVRQTVDGLIHWGQPIDESAQLLREEPFAAVAHVLVTPRDVSLRALAAMATGKDQTYTMVCGDDGGLVRALLGVDRLSEATVWVKGWEEAKEYVATHPNTWALLPWAYVDHRVQTLVVDGVRLRPEDLRGYPLVRRLWLEVVGALDAAVIDDLLAALHYDAGPTVELVAVGDIMLGRLVGERILASSPDYPFQGEGIGELLAADVTVGNLECPISEQGQPQSKTYTFRAPPSAVEGLVSAGFDMLSLANNHCNDFGTEALLDTFDILRDRGILYMGAGRTITEAYALRMMDVNGLRLGFLAYNQVPPLDFAATADRPGSALADPARIKNDLAEGLKLADLLIVSCHWGTEYASQPTASQRQLAAFLMEAGATLVIGHHPHVIQGLEYGTHALVAYSLGNFVFDMGVTGTSEGVALRCLLDVSGIKTVELLPYRIVQSQPRLLSGADGEALVERVLSLTQQLGTLPR